MDCDNKSGDEQLFPKKNDAFIIGSETFSTPEQGFRFRYVISTPLMLETLSMAEMIAIDATYMLKFPLIVVGTVDRSERYTPGLYALCSYEKTEDYKFIFESAKKIIKKHLDTELEPKDVYANGELLIVIRSAFHDIFKCGENLIPWSNNGFESHMAKVIST